MRLASSGVTSPGLKDCPHLIGDDIAFLAAPGGLLVQPFRQQKFFIYRQRVALIAADQFALLGLVRVLDISGMVMQTSLDGLAFVFPHRNQRVAASTSPPAKKKMPHIGGIPDQVFGMSQGSIWFYGDGHRGRVMLLLLVRQVAVGLDHQVDILFHLRPF